MATVRPPKRTRKPKDITTKKNKKQKKNEENAEEEKEEVPPLYENWEDSLVSHKDPNSIQLFYTSNVFQTNKWITNENEKFLLKILQKNVELQQELYWCLPTKSNTDDQFIKELLLNQKYSWPPMKESIQKRKRFNDSQFDTPFLGHKFVPGRIKTGNQPEIVEAIKKVLGEREDFAFKTGKENVDFNLVSQLYMDLKSGNPELWIFMIIKTLTGSRSLQLAVLRCSDVFFSKSRNTEGEYLRVAIRYRVMKGYDGHFLFQYKLNESEGDHRLDYSLPTLFEKLCARATSESGLDDPYLFSRLLGEKVEEQDNENRINTKLNAMLAPYGIPVHFTRDVCVFLGKASGLKMEEIKKYLNHSENSKSTENYYSNLANIYSAYNDADTIQRIFGTLLTHIKMAPVIQTYFPKGKEDDLFKLVEHEYIQAEVPKADRVPNWFEEIIQQKKETWIALAKQLVNNGKNTFTPYEIYVTVKSEIPELIQFRVLSAYVLHNDIVDKHTILNALKHFQQSPLQFHFRCHNKKV